MCYYPIVNPVTVFLDLTLWLQKVVFSVCFHRPKDCFSLICTVRDSWVLCQKLVQLKVNFLSFSFSLFSSFHGSMKWNFCISRHLLSHRNASEISLGYRQAELCERVFNWWVKKNQFVHFWVLTVCSLQSL